MLHQFDNEQEASKKPSSATKKNRLSLAESVVSVPPGDDHPGRFEFVVSILDGRMSWCFAANSAEDRDKWIVALQQGRCISHP